MIPLKFGYAPLQLENFPTFEEKVDAMIAYLEIYAIFCALEKDVNAKDLTQNHYLVKEVLVPGGKASYIKDLLLVNMAALEESLESFLVGEEDFYTIRKTLESKMETCLRLSKKNDVYSNFTFNENEIMYLTLHKNEVIRSYNDQLTFDQNVRNQIYDQFLVRKEFYKEVIELIDKKLTEHLEMPSFTKTPYKWKSENAHLEIAELLYSLLGTKIDIKKGGSNAKFVKQFYNLFGLDDTPYHAKLQQVRNRLGKQSWLQILPDYINSLQERNQVPKKKP